MSIVLLTQETIDKIAAGEVVERPLNVVKELVENSMDAGSNAISVEIKGGGTDFIRVTDNGNGIPAQDINNAFLRHATSKIQSSEDLNNITSLGFRGEALSSISAVSRLTMTTKTKDSLTGIQYVIEGGRCLSNQEIGAPSGTTIVVRDLFYNVPARRKFLRSNTAEAGSVTELMEQLALSRPDISFKYIINNKQRFNTTGKGDLKEVIYRLYGKEITDNIIFIESALPDSPYSIKGYTGTPYIDKGIRSFEHFFINGRFLKDDYLQKGLEDAYNPYLMQHRFPFCVLHLSMPPSLVDVNVHPAKLQVLFSDPDTVYKLVKDSVGSALKDHEMLKSIKFFEKEELKEDVIAQQSLNKEPVPEPFERVTSDKAPGADVPAVDEWGFTEDLEWDIDFETDQVMESSDYDNSKEISGDIVSDPVIELTYDTPQTERKASSLDEGPVIKDAAQLDMFTQRLIDPALRDRYEIIGQLFDTYYLIQYKDELLIMDQHAAHEKVKYEKLMKELKSSHLNSTSLMPPALIELPGKLEAVYESYRDYFAQMGFELESLGDTSHALRCVPLELYGCEPADMFMTIIEELSQGPMSDVPEVILSKLASVACKAAVKGNSPLSLKEAGALVDELMGLENPYHCPHGRPTVIKMSKAELEKRFKRTL